MVGRTGNKTKDKEEAKVSYNEIQEVVESHDGPHPERHDTKKKKKITTSGRTEQGKREIVMDQMLLMATRTKKQQRAMIPYILKIDST